MDANSFSTTPVKLLQAQQAAHHLLTECKSYLSRSQELTLRDFQHKMATKRTRSKLKSAAAWPILNMATKINRQLFQAHRHLSQQAQQ